jgi:hypothetical protein
MLDETTIKRLKTLRSEFKGMIDLVMSEDGINKATRLGESRLITSLKGRITHIDSTLHAGGA